MEKISKFLHFFSMKGKSEESKDHQYKKNILSTWFKKIGFKWCDFENLLFWDTPFFSLVVYLICTGIFWKFIISLFQKIALLIIVIALPLSINELRYLVINYVTADKQKFKLEKKEKHLPFTLNDVTDFGASMWILFEDHITYLVNLKDNASTKLAIWLGFYVSIVIIMLAYVPLANIIYALFNILYFYPLFAYTNIPDIIFEKFKKTLQPAIIHWQHSQTKRKRDHISQPNDDANKISDEFDDNFSNDSENDMFLPESNLYNDKMLTSAIPVSGCYSLSTNISFDDEDQSSDFDGDSFLPSEKINNPLQSFSQFDSMMEPLEDDFHAGLAYNEANSISSSKFGIPLDCQHKNSNASFDEFDTDNEIEDLPLEETDFRSKYFSNEKILNRNDDGEYEMLEKEELHNVTDQELNEYIENSKNKISNFLGY